MSGSHTHGEQSPVVRFIKAAKKGHGVLEILFACFGSLPLHQQFTSRESAWEATKGVRLAR